MTLPPRTYPHGASPLIGLIPLLEPMSNLPQSVTDRYVSSLVSAGYNKEFKIDSITCLPFVAEEVHCGHYFRASIIPTAGGELVTSAGPTLHQAVRAALAKAGVTFR